jgi:ATPase subunit of ABC transporter with duplicated ATPase domains
MQLTCTSLSFSYPDQPNPVFEGVTFSVRSDSRLGIIGPNGSGKSTLLHLLAGRLKQTGGVITRSRPAPRLALVEMEPGDDTLVLASALKALDARLSQCWQALQSGECTGAAMVVAEFAQLDGYAAVAHAKEVLAGFELGDGQWQQSVRSLSVGERLWLRMAEAVLADADILVLDEPTSHLDIRKRAELATMLRDIHCPYIVVSHDRHFLDLVCTEILELAKGHARLYPGGYSDYIQTVRAREERDRDVYDVQTRKVRQLKKAVGGLQLHAQNIEQQAQGSIESQGFYSHKAARMEKRAKGIRTQLERSLAEAQAAKPFVEKRREFMLGNDARGGILCSLARVTVSRGGRTLFQDLSMTVRGGEHWCVLGPNGAGKTTLLDVLNGSEPPSSGEAFVSPSARIGLVPQQVVQDRGDAIPVDIVCNGLPARAGEARILLGTLGIEDDDVFRPMCRLSAGQQKRVLIAQLVMERPDILIIDELEGNLAVDAVTKLEKALVRFPGAIVMVTHDVALAAAVGSEFVALDGYGGWSRDGPTSPPPHNLR